MRKNAKRSMQVICLDVVSIVLCLSSIKIAYQSMLDGRWPDDLHLVVWFIGVMALFYAVLLIVTPVSLKTMLVVSGMLAVLFYQPVKIWHLSDGQMIMTRNMVAVRDGARVVVAEVPYRVTHKPYGGCENVGGLFPLDVLLGLGIWDYFCSCRPKRKIKSLARHAKRGIGSSCRVSLVA